jgi:SAM-dependent methyltransferase
MRITKMKNEHLQANRKLWNTRTPLHLESDFYDVRAFRQGATSPCGLELQEMGSVSNKSLLHLQCHFGLDTLSLAREGAVVTGVDFSESAITSAKQLAGELDIAADFLCCDVLELKQHLQGEFDIVFTSFGVLGWLPDLKQWAKVIIHFLKPGGVLYLLEFHPYFIQFDDEGQLTYDYFHSKQPDEEVATTTYADRAEHAPLSEFWWNHSMSDLFSALREANLEVDLFHEFPYSAYKTTEAMIEAEPGRWVHRRLERKIPYMFSIQANKIAASCV